MRHPALLPLALPLALALALGGCGKSGDKAPQQAASGAPEAEPGLAVSGGELVLPAVMGNPGAAYFTLTNNGPKPASLAAVSIDGTGKTEMHQTAGGSMTPLKTADVASGATLAFARSGNHVMVFDIDPAIAAGGTVEMTLTFADGDKLSTSLAVKAAGDMAGMDHDAM